MSQFWTPIGQAPAPVPFPSAAVLEAANRVAELEGRVAELESQLVEANARAFDLQCQAHEQQSRLRLAADACHRWSLKHRPYHWQTNQQFHAYWQALIWARGLGENVRHLAEEIDQAIEWHKIPKCGRCTEILKEGEEDWCDSCKEEGDANDY